MYLVWHFSSVEVTSESLSSYDDIYAAVSYLSVGSILNSTSGVFYAVLSCLVATTPSVINSLVRGPHPTMRDTLKLSEKHS